MFSIFSSRGIVSSVSAVIKFMKKKYIIMSFLIATFRDIYIGMRCSHVQRFSKVKVHCTGF